MYRSKVLNVSTLQIQLSNSLSRCAEVWIQQCLQLGLLAINCKEKGSDLLF